MRVTGQVELDGATAVTLTATTAIGDQIQIIDNDLQDAVIGTFSDLPNGSQLLLNGQEYGADYFSGTGNDVVLTRAGPMLSITRVRQNEGQAGAAESVFTVTVDRISDLPITVNYFTADDSAVAPDDYLSRSGTLTFAPGQQTQTLAVTVIGEANPEFDERFHVVLTQPVNAGIARDTAIGKILDDDEGPVLVDNLGTEFWLTFPGTRRQKWSIGSMSCFSGSLGLTTPPAWWKFPGWDSPSCLPSRLRPRPPSQSRLARSCGIMGGTAASQKPMRRISSATRESTSWRMKKWPCTARTAHSTIECLMTRKAPWVIRS